MGDTDGARGYPLAEPRFVKYTTDYVRRLLVERHHIYEKLRNPGGSIILTSTARVDQERYGVEYNSMIGSSFHLDLMELDMRLKRLVQEGQLTRHELEALLLWMDGMNSQQAAVYLNATGSVSRKRKSRGIGRVTGSLNERKDALPSLRGGQDMAMPSVRDVTERREVERIEPAQDGDSGPEDRADVRSLGATPERD